MSASHLTHQAPDLAEEKAKQLEDKLAVAMAEIQSVGDDRDESTLGKSMVADRQEHRREIY
jgi:hypothetical protein